MTSIVIAIDGTAGSGTSTLTRNLCRALRHETSISWQRFNTGSVYRALAWFCLKKGVALDDIAGVIRLSQTATLHFTDGVVDSVDDLHVSEDELSILNDEAKTVAKIEEVRVVVRDWQHHFAADNTFVIMEGRDIGTTVFPDAAIKIWVDADPAERARRRALKEGHTVTEAEVLERDQEDREREVSPMSQAPDAIAYDSTDFDETQLLEAVQRDCLDRLDL